MTVGKDSHRFREIRVVVEKAGGLFNAPTDGEDFRLEDTRCGADVLTISMLGLVMFEEDSKASGAILELGAISEDLKTIRCRGGPPILPFRDDEEEPLVQQAFAVVRLLLREIHLLEEKAS